MDTKTIRHRLDQIVTIWCFYYLLSLHLLPVLDTAAVHIWDVSNTERGRICQRLRKKNKRLNFKNNEPPLILTFGHVYAGVFLFDNSCQYGHRS